MVNPEPARKRFDEQIRNSKGSHKLAAQGALGSVNILTRLSDKNNGPLQGKDLEKAKTAIAGLVYNEVIRTSNVKQKSQDADKYVEQVKKLSAQECFTKCLPPEINTDTINKFIEDETAVTELANKVKLEMSKNLGKQNHHDPVKQNEQPQNNMQVPHDMIKNGL